MRVCRLSAAVGVGGRRVAEQLCQHTELWMGVWVCGSGAGGGGGPGRPSAILIGRKAAVWG